MLIYFILVISQNLKTVAMWDFAQDVLSLFIGGIFLFLSLFFVPEIRQKRRNVSVIIFLCVLTFLLAYSKLRRDNKKDEISKNRMREDSITIHRLDSNLQTVLSNRKLDSSDFSEFKKKLERDFHIRDSANNPVHIRNYKPIFNTHIDKAENVKIG